MIEKRINYRFGSEGYQGGATNQGGAGKGSGVERGDARDRAMGLQGKTGTVDKSLGTGPLGVDRSAVGQFSQFGRNLMQQNLRPSFTDRLKGMGSNIFGGILGLLNPALGFAYKGIGSLKNLGQYDNLADYFRGEFGQTEDEEDQVQTFDLGPSRNPMASFMPTTGIVNTPIGLDFINAPQNIEGYNTITAPSSNPQEYDFFSNAMAEVTQKDINASKARGFNMMDYDTARSIGMISPNVTSYEFEQLKQGNITEPGTYVG
jgi:hypothetical protein